MGIEEVKTEILAKARKDSERLLAEAEEEAAKIRKQFQQQLQDYRKQREAEKQKSLDMIKRMNEAQLQTELKMRSMDERKKWIENSFHEARKKIMALPEKQRKEHILKLLARAAKEIDIGTVYCASKDRKAVSGYAAKEVDILGGIIAETKDQNVRVDYSYDTLLEQVRENKLSELSKALFD